MASKKERQIIYFVFCSIFGVYPGSGMEKLILIFFIDEDTFIFCTEKPS
jgi:hypothetical protein